MHRSNVEYRYNIKRISGSMSLEGSLMDNIFDDIKEVSDYLKRMYPDHEGFIVWRYKFET